MSANDYCENNDLIRRVAEGDEEALALLCEKNAGLVRSIAQRFYDRGAESEDLIQIGTIGMIKAARSFDFSYGTAFSTYAVPLIIGEIRRFLRDDGTVKVSRGIKKLGCAVMREREAYISANGREPSIGELAEKLGAPPEELAFALEGVSPVHSLSEAVGGDDALTLENVIADKNNEIDFATDRIALSQAIGELPPLWRQIITLRYVKNLSQQQTGAALGMTQVKISREEKKILAELRRTL